MAIEEAKKNPSNVGLVPSWCVSGRQKLVIFHGFSQFRMVQKNTPKKKQKMVQPRLVALTLA